MKLSANLQLFLCFRTSQLEILVRLRLLIESALADCLYIVRHSVIELQSILASLIENFEFTVPSDMVKNPVMRKPSSAMTPIVEGHRGAWMGLKVRTLA